MIILQICCDLQFNHLFALVDDPMVICIIKPSLSVLHTTSRHTYDRENVEDAAIAILILSCQNFARMRPPRRIYLLV